MGAGGALFVRGSLGGHVAASVTLVNVSFGNDAADGGNGGADRRAMAAAPSHVQREASNEPCCALEIRRRRSV
jgi:hypothetical protein